VPSRGGGVEMDGWIEELKDEMKKEVFGFTEINSVIE